ncbi:hypothetical protein OKW21_000576 [Catalinimonas alkaloidigena]|uniref:T9SS type B sorting domain-containing protein n=1 Tax=Catalinimonas alkaloidigena TaxID=1075417 RepID=UPI0024061A4D|nr:gliding motility-associated C-terminal domain-containing protein [Catalinimonas alkaloidigena]MDF9795313.1 hypothetical protein [Catalinimonas alkaloidigena]
MHVVSTILNIYNEQNYTVRRVCMVVFFWTLFVGAKLEAQSLFIGSEQTVWVEEGGLISLNGDAENYGQITNQGEISISGDWQNQGQYVAGTGLLTLAGSETQNFAHGDQEVYQLALMNGGDKILLDDVSISSLLKLTNGILRAENNATVYLEAEAQSNGGNNSSFVEGKVVSTGTGYKQFPLGSGELYHPLTLLDVQGNNPLIGVEVSEPHPAPASLSGLESISTSRYWQLDVLSGTYEGSVVRIGITDEPDFSDLTGLVVAAAPAVATTYESLGASEIVGKLDDGSVTSAEPTTLSVISLGLSSEFSERGKVLVPNAFAPDSPLEEDRSLSIFAVNLLPESFVFRIFNRWGKLVYETTSLGEALQTGWNGINQETNQPAQFGVYSYYLSGKFSNDETVIQKGTLTLFR